MELFLCTLQDYKAVGLSAELAQRRYDWFKQTEDRWFVQRDITPHLLVGDDQKFQRHRRIDAERIATGDFYILADDDCEPDGFDTAYVSQLMVKYPSFAIIAFMPSNETISPWTPEGRTDVVNDDELMEHHSVGGIRICRKHTMPEWPAQTGSGYDQTQCDDLRDRGWKVGYAKRLTANHLGKGRENSTVWTLQQLTNQAAP